MARIRTIKPDFFLNEELAELTPLHRLLFQGLWLLADREGRMQDRPRRIKASVLPYDDCNVDLMLADLDQAGFITRYVIEGRGYIQINGFAKHQRPHHKEPASEIPSQSQISKLESSMDQASSNVEPSLDRSCAQEGKGREGKGTEELTPLTPLSGHEHEVAFEDLWKAFTAKIDNRSSKVRAKSEFLALVNGYGPERIATIAAGLERWIESADWRDKIKRGEPQYIKRLHNWLAEGDWADDPTPAKPPGTETDYRAELRKRLDASKAAA